MVILLYISIKRYSEIIVRIKVVTKWLLFINPYYYDYKQSITRTTQKVKEETLNYKTITL